MGKQRVGWVCSRYWISGWSAVPTGKNWAVSPARRAHAGRRARLAMMVRRLARRVGLSVALMVWVWVFAYGVGPASSAELAPTDAPSAASAVEASEIAEVTVEPVVVSETRTEKSLSRATGSVYVITREQLEKRQFPYLRDILRDVPGLTIVQTGSRGGTTSLFTRGGESDFTMVMIDGVKVNDAGGGFEFANLTTDNVERIEIVKGPQSALYGSDAIGGVINIITRKGDGPTKVVGEVMAGGGRGLGSTMLTHQERLGVSGALDRVDYSAEWTQMKHAGMFSLNNSFQNNVFSGNFGLRASDKLQFRSTFRYTDSRFKFPTDSVAGRGFPPVDGNQGNERTLTNFGVSATYQPTPWWEHVLQWSHMDSRFKFFDFRDPIPSDTRFSQTDGTQRRDMLDYHTNFTVREGVWSGSALTFGAEFQEERFSQSNVVSPGTSASTNLSRKNQGYYAQLQGVYADRLFIMPGIRVEENEFFGQFVNPKVSGAYLHKETGTKVRGTLGRGIRAPAFNELVGFPNFGIPSNFNLKPEKATSWEVGLDQDLLGKDLTASVTWFHNDFKDLIALSTGLNNNIQGAKTQGLESQLSWRVTRALRLSATHTYLKTVITDTGGVGGTAQEASSLLKRRPEHSGNVQVDYQRPTWGANLMVLGLGDRVDRDFAINPAGQRMTNKGFVRVDLSGWYALGRFEGANWKAKLRIENLTDSRYHEAFHFPNPGVFALAGLEAVF